MLLKVSETQHVAATLNINSYKYNFHSDHSQTSVLADARTQSQDAAPPRRAPRHHLCRHGNQPPPGGRLHHPAAPADWLPAAPVGQRESNHEEAEPVLPGGWVTEENQSATVPIID